MFIRICTYVSIHLSYAYVVFVRLDIAAHYPLAARTSTSSAPRQGLTCQGQSVKQRQFDGRDPTESIGRFPLKGSFKGGYGVISGAMLG